MVFWGLRSFFFYSSANFCKNTCLSNIILIVTICIPFPYIALFQCNFTKTLFSFNVYHDLNGVSIFFTHFNYSCNYKNFKVEPFLCVKTYNYEF